MSGVKDPFQILADELTLIRKDMDRLERTSLDRDEAAALNEMIVASMDKMAALVMDAARALTDGAARNRDQIARNTEQAAARAAHKAVEGLHEHLDAERLKFSQAAGEARREAWRWFGGFLGVAGLYARHRGAFGRAGDALDWRNNLRQRVRKVSTYFLHYGRR